ncbi:hypothetical protein HUX53_10925 [Actinomadura sp. BRA 177]|nr:hypothetical protein [Actinomadura sp. BRA 177]
MLVGTGRLRHIAQLTRIARAFAVLILITRPAAPPGGGGFAPRAFVFIMTTRGAARPRRVAQFARAARSFVAFVLVVRPRARCLRLAAGCAGLALCAFVVAETRGAGRLRCIAQFTHARHAARGFVLITQFTCAGRAACAFALVRFSRADRATCGFVLLAQFTRADRAAYGFALA